MNGDGASGLFGRPVLVRDPGFHTAPITGADVDKAGRSAATGSLDRTVRIWALKDGTLKRTIRLPQGRGNVGNVYAVAISPDGTLVAAGGWTRKRAADEQEQIYVFSTVSGMPRHRIEGLPNGVASLAFSPSGERLAVGLGIGGLRLYTRDGGDRWMEAAADDGCHGAIYGVAFAADGGFATTCNDGKLRLYGPSGDLLVSPVAVPHDPYGLAFNPVDGRLAVGFADAPNVLLYDGATLEPVPSPNVDGLDNGNLISVA